MKIRYINNDGGGYASEIELAGGTTIDQFFVKHLPDRDAADYLIRVNRSPVSPEQVLQEGDVVTITPTKIEGA